MPSHSLLLSLAALLAVDAVFCQQLNMGGFTLDSYMTTLNLESGADQPDVYLSALNEGKCRPTLSDCPDFIGTKQFVGFNASAGRPWDPEFTLPIWVDGKTEPLRAMTQGTCEVAYYIGGGVEAEFDLKLYAMNGKQGDGAPALPQQKLSDTTFPAGKDIYEAMLYKTSDRKRLNFALQARMSHDHNDFCHSDKCASDKVPGFCLKCCTGRTANHASNDNCRTCYGGTVPEFASNAKCTDSQNPNYCPDCCAGCRFQDEAANKAVIAANPHCQSCADCHI